VSGVGFPAPSYQWQRMNNSSTWGNLANNNGFAGVATPTLTVASGSAVITVGNAGSYRVILSNTAGSVTSQVATLTVVQTFAGAQVFPIPAVGGTATPYPRLSASVPAFTASTVKHVTLSLTLSHPEPYDVNILLTTPTPAFTRKVQFMGGLGPVQHPFETPAPGGLYSYPVTNAVLTFDDGAATPAPTIYPLYAGTFRPTVSTPVVAFPTPAPALPYGTNFASFVGFNQTSTGSWRLYVNDVAQDIPAVGADGRISTWNVTLTVGP
jgi:hypothetical protein